MRPAETSCWKVKSGVYFAPVGQMLHVSHRRQTLRPRQGRVFLATGLVQTGMPAPSTHSRRRSRVHDKGMEGMGYGAPRGSSSGGPGSPATPIRSSASW